MNHFDNPDKGLEIRDKLEYLFEMQKSLITQDYNSTKIKSNEEIPVDTIPENKMKKLYEMEEPFLGYRIFMISSALVHEAIELQRETNWKWWKNSSYKSYTYNLELKKFLIETFSKFTFFVNTFYMGL